MYAHVCADLVANISEHFGLGLFALADAFGAMRFSYVFVSYALRGNDFSLVRHECLSNRVCPKGAHFAADHARDHMNVFAWCAPAVSSYSCA